MSPATDRIARRLALDQRLAFLEVKSFGALDPVSSPIYLNVPSISNSRGPVAFAVQEMSFPFKDAQAPVANVTLLFPDPFHPVTLPSAMIRSIFPSDPWKASTFPGERSTQ
jgi:hypothetical protein